MTLNGPRILNTLLVFLVLSVIAYACSGCSDSKPEGSCSATIIKTSTDGFSRSVTFFVDEKQHYGHVMGEWGEKGEKIVVTCFDGGRRHEIGNLK